MGINHKIMKIMFMPIMVSLCGVSCFAVNRIEPNNFSLTVHSDKTIGYIDKRIYGQFLEHIYHSCSNGIWGEVVWNRSFEERLSPDEWSVKDNCLVSPVENIAESLFTFDRAWNVSEVKMEFMRLTGTGDVLAGLNCSGNNRYLVVFGADGQYRLENEGSVVQTTKGQKIEVGQWTNVRLRRVNQKFQVWIGDHPLFDFNNDKAGPGKGGVSIGVRGTRAQFRNLKVTDFGLEFDTFELAGVTAADPYGKSSLGQTIRVEKPRLNQISIAVACWKGVSVSGFKMEARLEGPKGRLIASRQLPPGLHEGELVSLGIPEPLSIGTVLYVKMIPDAGVKENIIGWWSKEEDLYAPGKAYVNDQPVTGDRFVKPSYLPDSIADGLVLFEGLPFMARHWFSFGKGEISISRDRPLNSTSCIKVVSESGETGVSQNNYSVRKGDKLCGSLWSRGDAQEGLIVRLMDESKVLDENTLTVKTGEWKEYPLLLESNITAKNASLHILTRGKASIWIDQISLMPDSARDIGGFRPDLFKAIADSRPATIRWPGGTFVYGYQWKNGIGPQHERIGKGGWDELDPLSFGTDEFIQLCREVDAEPIMVIDIGPAKRPEDFGPFIQAACDWVEYCNGPATSKWGSVRASNGHPEPYGVKYWELGNENWGLTRQQYGDVLRAFAPAIKKANPTVQLIGCGGTLGEIGAANDLAIIEDCAQLVDYISIHHYEAPDRFLQGVIAFDEHITSLGQRIAKSANPALKIYVSEWNTLICQDWRGGLYAGGLLNLFESSKDMAMSCPALWLRHVSAPDWFNAFIDFNHHGWYPAPSYIVMKLFRDSYAPNRLEVTGEQGGLSVVAAMSDDKKYIYLKIVNALDKAVDVDLAIKGGFVASKQNLKLITADSLKIQNSLQNPNLIKVINSAIETNEGKSLFTLPRWSVVVVEFARGE